MKINYYSIGCKVNQYECEALITEFTDNGFILGENDKNNDVFIINTCSVTNNSEVKCRKAIRKSIKNNPKAIIVVMGCYSQISPKELGNIKGVDLIFGTTNRLDIYNEVIKIIENKKNTNNKKYHIKKIESFVTYENLKINQYLNKTRAFIKIEDGCENFCSYCIIPYTRGKVKSRQPHKIVDEVKRLVVNNKTKEIVLTGINLGCYGEDFGDTNLEMLITQILAEVQGDYRIRISSIEVTKITDRLIELIKENPNKICNHLHIPIQSASDRTLNFMNRKYNYKLFKDVINKIRKKIPNVNITTDVIVGFPTELEEDYLETFSRIKELLFGEMHVFVFSKRKGTSAALLEQSSNSVVLKCRSNKLIELSNIMAVAYREKCKDLVFNVLIEKIIDEMCVGHSENYLCIQFKDNNYKVNQIVKVKLTNALYPISIGEYYEI